MARKQSAADRQGRLDKGCCPIHGIGMSQISSWYEELDWEKRRTRGKQFTLTSDGREDCPLVAKAYAVEGPYYLLPKWEHVLDGESDADLAPREDLALPKWELEADFYVKEPHYSDQPLRYSVLIQWSDADTAYHVSMPEWEGRIATPITKAETYTEAAYEGYIALKWLTERAERERWPLPLPLTLHR